MTEAIEPRIGTVLRTGLKPPSSNYSVCQCPFCGSPVRAYWWSLAGSGKRCDCGAKFDSALVYTPPPGTTFDPKKRKFVKERTRKEKT